MRSAEETRAFLSARIGANPGLPPARVVFTENSTTMVSRSDHDGATVLRIHRIFRSAPETLLADIVCSFYSPLTRRKILEIRGRLKDFIESRRPDISLKPFPVADVLAPAGAAFDLQAVLDRVSAEHFPDVGGIRIGWSRQVLKRLMGKWIENPVPFPNLVLINRLLDTPEVPEYYLEFLVFHELLHETMPISRSEGRWIRHPPEFRAREREFPEFRRAREWEAENIARLYRKYGRKRSGIPGRRPR